MQTLATALENLALASQTRVSCARICVPACVSCSSRELLFAWLDCEGAPAPTSQSRQKFLCKL